MQQPAHPTYMDISIILIIRLTTIMYNFYTVLTPQIMPDWPVYLWPPPPPPPPIHTFDQKKLRLFSWRSCCHLSGLSWNTDTFVMYTIMILSGACLLQELRLMKLFLLHYMSVTVSPSNISELRPAWCFYTSIKGNQECSGTYIGKLQGTYSWLYMFSLQNS